MKKLLLIIAIIFSSCTAEDIPDQNQTFTYDVKIVTDTTKIKYNDNGDRWPGAIYTYDILVDVQNVSEYEKNNYIKLYPEGITVEQERDGSANNYWEITIGIYHDITRKIK